MNRSGKVSSRFEPNHFHKAYRRIKSTITTTPCRRSSSLSCDTGGAVYLKLENLQLTGSFKIRGVANKLLSMSSAALQSPFIAASTGNHGAAFAHLVSQFGLTGKLFVPETITSVKLAGIQKYKLPITKLGRDCVETELAAARYAKENGGTFVGPYNDTDIILGQGTLGVELIQQVKDVDFVFVPIGGGGLVSGIASYLKSVSPNTKIIGCQPENSAVMYHSIQAGKIITMESLPTLSDATAGGIEPGSITFDLCRDFVDDIILVSEEAILDSLKHLHHHEGVLCEGGSAMTLAAMNQMKNHLKGKRVVLLISGGKVSQDVLEKIGEKDG